MPNNVIRFKNYNYYPNGVEKVEDIFEYWRSTNPLIHYRHMDIRNIKSYTFTYEFNGKRW